MLRRRLVIALLGAASMWASKTLAQAQAPQPRIEDNSFLIEEAYNQGRGVVQHINTLSVPREGGAWAYTFTQEWPLAGLAHQVSYTVPILTAGTGRGSGLGDVALNNRYQLADGEGSGLAIAPRLTLLVPSGSSRQGRGAGALGAQVNLPVSLVISPWVVTHANAGLTVTSSAKNAFGQRATSRSLEGRSRGSRE